MKHPLANTQPSKGANIEESGHVARGGHGVPKVLIGPAMPYPSTPCRQATPETALRPFQRWPTHRAGGLWPYSTPSDTCCGGRKERVRGAMRRDAARGGAMQCGLRAKHRRLGAVNSNCIGFVWLTTSRSRPQHCGTESGKNGINFG
jgi:hypothetical protein